MVQSWFNVVQTDTKRRTIMKSTKFIKPIALVTVVDSAESIKSRYSVKKLGFDYSIKLGNLLRKAFDRPNFKPHLIIGRPPKFVTYVTGVTTYVIPDMPRFKPHVIIDMPKIKTYVGENRKEYRMVDFRRIGAREIIKFKLFVMSCGKVMNRVSNCLPMSENSVCTRGDDYIEARTNIMFFKKKSRIKKHQCRKSAVIYPTAGGDKFAWIRKKLGRLWETTDRLLKVTRREFSSGYSYLAVFNDCQITAQEVRTGPTSVIADRIYALTNNAEVVMTKRIIRHNMFAV